MGITISTFSLPHLPFLKPRDTFAIDIGTSSIKVLYLKKSGSRYVIQSWGILPILDSGSELSPQDRKGMIVARLAEFIAREKITTKNIVSSVSGNQVVVRYVKFPAHSREVLMRTIQFEAEPYIPFDINDVDLGIHIIGNMVEDGQKKFDSILVAAKKDIAQSRLEIFSDLNLRPIIIDVDAFALANAYELSSDPSIIETVLLVNIGAAITNLALIDNHIPRVVRDIFIAGNSFTKSIQKNISGDFVSAEIGKARCGLLISVEDKERMLADDQREALQVSSALIPVARELISEIQKLIDFYVGQNSDKVVSKLLLSGGSAALPNLDTYIQQELKIPVIKFNPVASLSGGDRIDNDDAIRMAVVAGLAIRQENDSIKQ